MNNQSCCSLIYRQRMTLFFILLFFCSSGHQKTTREMRANPAMERTRAHFTVDPSPLSSSSFYLSSSFFSSSSLRTHKQPVHSLVPLFSDPASRLPFCITNSMNSTRPSQINFFLKGGEGREKKMLLHHPTTPPSLPSSLPWSWHSEAGQQYKTTGQSSFIARREGFYPEPHNELMFLELTFPCFTLLV